MSRHRSMHIWTRLQVIKAILLDKLSISIAQKRKEIRSACISTLDFELRQLESSPTSTVQTNNSQYNDLKAYAMKSIYIQNNLSDIQYITCLYRRLLYLQHYVHCEVNFLLFLIL